MKNFQLRLASCADAEALLEIYAYYIQNSSISFEVETPPLHVFAARIEHICAKYPYIVCEAKGSPVAYAYLSAHMERAAYQWNAIPSIYAHKNFTGMGLGKALFGALIDLALEMGLHNLYSGVTCPNPPSDKLHRSCGFKQLAVYEKVGFKMGRWHDVVWYEKRIAPPTLNPVPPRSLHELPQELVRRILDKHQDILNASPALAQKTDSKEL